MTKNDELMPREKLLTLGAKHLTDAELLAIFLRTGTKEMPVLELSQFVLDEFGSLRELLSASLDDFCQIKGLGLAKYIQLQASKEMIKRYLYQQLQENEAINNPMIAVRYLQTELENDEREIFMALFLDNHHRLIKVEKLFFGTINQAEVHPREIIKEGLKCNAAAVIIAHNHPSGICEPSDADRQLTEKIKLACELVDIRLVDHIIVGKGDFFSFEEEKFDLEIS